MNFTIPGDLEGITLRQFMAYHIAKDEAEKVRVITGLSDQEVGRLPVNTIGEIIMLFDEVLNQKPKKFERVFKIQAGKLKMEVGFIPDLTRITLAEHVDLDEYSNRIWLKGNKENFEDLPKLLAVLFRPVTEKLGAYYNIETYNSDTRNKWMQFFDGMNMAQVKGAWLFFSTIENELLGNSLSFFQHQQLRKAMKAIRTA